MKKTKTQKGITLIALIITIVVLLILAAVTISSIQNDGILHYAQNAADSWNKAQTNETEILGGYVDLLNKYNGTPNKETEEDLAFMERYILGAKKTGRLLTDIMDMNTLAFLDDKETTDVDESTRVTLYDIGENENATKRLFICKI